MRILATISPPKAAWARLASFTFEPSVTSRVQTCIRQNPVEKNTATTRILRTSSFNLATAPVIRGSQGAAGSFEKTARRPRLLSRRRNDGDIVVTLVNRGYT